MTGNSVLDDIGDVVLYTASDGAQYLFRAGNPDGLLLASTGTGWTLTRNVHTHTVHADGSESWRMVLDAEPICAGERTTVGYEARHIATGRVIRRHDTQYGLLAKVARFYLRAVDGTTEAEDGEG